MNVDSYIDGKLKIYDDVFPIEIIRELEVENSSLLFSFGAYDNKENPVPTGLAAEGITHTKTFKLLWEF